nr:hypothetical protein [Tanacetum cinerariifolium]
MKMIDEDGMEEMDIKWNMALLSMRANKFWKKTGKKISIQGSDMAGFDKSKDWSYMANDEEDHALVIDEFAPTEYALMANTNAESKEFDNSLCSKDCKKNYDSLNSKITDLTDKLFDANNLIYHCKLALAQVESRLFEYKEREVKYCEKIRTLEFYNESNNECIKILKKKLETLKEEKEGVDGKLAGLLQALMDIDNLIKSQRSDKIKDGLGYSVVPPPPAQLYLSPKKDLSWTGLPECADDIVTDYSRPSPTVERGCKITGKWTIKTDKLEFENVYFVKDLKDFKLLNDANILLRTPRQHNIYSIDLKNIVSHRDHTCLVAKASVDKCTLWHRRLGHLNFKRMNRLVRHNLVRGLPTKCFDNDHTCTACLKGKQNKASCKSKLVNFVSKPLHTLHMDLFGPTSVSSISHKWYCLVVTDDFSKFTWTFFLKSKNETSGILKKFITEIENLKDLKVKIIKCDNGGEFRSKEMNDFCSQKGIKGEFSNDRTPQQNGVAERRNRTLREAARTMLVDAKHPVTFWAEAVNTAYYV